MPATSRRYVCSDCGEKFRSSLPRRVDGKKYCQDCFLRQFVHCNGCGEVLDRSRADRHGTNSYCEDCFSELFTDCTACGSEIEVGRAHAYVHASDDPTENESPEELQERTDHYCNSCRDNLFRQCANCGNRHLRNAMRESPYGDLYCQPCWEASCIYCSDCGNITWQRNVRWHGDEAMCPDCSVRTDEWDQKNFECESPTYDRVGTQRKFGIEIETSRCNNHWELYGGTIWACEYDCSVSGKEFISPPMFGDQGLDSVLDFCREAQNRDWRVDDRCGLHIHFDMSDMEPEQLFSLAYAYRLSWSLWKRFVSDHRGSYGMCGSPRYSLDEIRASKSWEYFVGARDRFEYVNWRAYFKHGTFEIRLGEPTLDGPEIVDWVSTHGLFIERVKNMTFDEIDAAFGDGSSSTRGFSFCANFVWQDHPELITHLRSLSQRYHGRGIQIRGRRHYPEHAIFRSA